MAVVEALPRSFCLCCIDLLCFQGVGLLLHGTSSLLGISSAAAAGFVAGIDDDELIRFEDVYVAGRVGRGHIVRWFAECELTVASSGELASVCAVSFDRRVSVEGGAPEDNLDAGKRLRHRAVGLGIHRCELEIVL
jgi:hypothetical protein